MLTTKTIKIKSSNYYKDLGYNIDEKYIDIKVEDLKKGSHLKIEACCDYCGTIKNISYKDYNKNISTFNKFSCSIKCGTLKAKETNLIKYGVDSTNKLSSVKDKTKATILKKWGVDHISKVKEINDVVRHKLKEQSSDISKRIKEYNKSLSIEEKERIKDKRYNTNLIKYGKGYVSQVDSIKEKIKETVFEKWGGYTYQSNLLMYKVKQTNIEKYGYEIPSKNEDVKKKTYLTNMSLWGFKTPSMNNIVKDNTKNTLLSKYNVVNIMYSEDFIKKLYPMNQVILDI